MRVVSMTTCACGSGKPVVAWGRCRPCYDRDRKAGALPKRVTLGTAACERCGKVRQLHAKGRCKSCYNVVSASTSRMRSSGVGAT